MTGGSTSDSNTGPCPIAVVIISYNEEPNLAYALQSVTGWAQQVFVVDSFSADATVAIAHQNGAQVHQHAFETVGQQRNWALDNLPIDDGWVLFLDADEYLSEELKQEIRDVAMNSDASAAAYVTAIQFMYLGRWLRHGDLYRNVIRMVRKGCGRYIDTEAFHEKLVIDGPVGKLRSYIVHDDHHSVCHWVEKQMPRIVIDARMAVERSTSAHPGTRADSSSPVTIEGGRNRWFRQKVARVPGPLRPFAQFFYRYIVRGGFLDGWQGFLYHFLLQFWYPLMVEAVATELRYRQSTASTSKLLQP